MSDPILPLAVWQAGTLQNSIPANDNALRMEAMSRKVLSDSTTAQPGSPSDGDVYIIASTHTGAQWTTFTVGDIAIYRGGTWTAFAPVAGVVLNVNGTQKQWTGSAWSAIGGGGSSAPNVQAVTSSATVTPTYSNDIVEVTAQAAALAIANPTGTAVNGHPILFRIKDNGTARAISFGSDYLGIGGSLPTTTTAGKWMYFTGFYSSADSKVHVILPAAVQP